MVEVVKWTFAAPKIACASERVIQSAAEGIGQSEVRAGGFVEAPGSAVFAVAVAVDVDVDDSVFPLPAGMAAPVSPSEDEAAALSASDEPDSADPSSFFDDAPDLIAARRSFLAQPVPR